jgi:hypothetical protein
LLFSGAADNSRGMSIEFIRRAAEKTKINILGASSINRSPLAGFGQSAHTGLKHYKSVFPRSCGNQPVIAAA